MSAICNSLIAQEKSVEVSVDVEVVNGEEQRNVLIKIGEGDANKEIKWKDNGTIPDEIKQMLEKEGIDLKMLSSDEDVEVKVESVDVKKVEKEVEIIKIIGDEEGEHTQDISIDKEGDSEITIIKIKGDQEIPEDVKKLLEEHDIDIEKLKQEALHEAKDHDTKVIKRKAIKIKTKDEDGNESLIEWNGNEGELPQDIRELLEREGIDLDGDGEHKMIFIGEDNDIQDINISKDTKKQYRIKTIDDEGNERIIEWNGEGEMPEEIKHIESGTKKKIKVIKKKSTNRAQLGVMIENHDLGVKVVGLVPGMPADRIGLKTGSIITKINEKEIDDIEDLLATIRPLSPEESITIDYLYQDTYYADIEVRLKKAEDHANHFIFKDVQPNHKQTFALFNKIADCDPKDTEKDEEAIKAWRAKPDIPKSRQLDLDSFTAYPNPSNGMLNISFEGNEEPTLIQITDITGKEIHKEIINDFNGSYNNDLDLSSYPKGQFILYVIQNQKIFTESIILQ